MTDQVGECNVNNTLLLENAFSVKDGESQNDDIADEKIDISETAIIVDNLEMQDHLLPDQVKQYDFFSTSENAKMEPLSSKIQYNTLQNNLKLEDRMSLNDIKIEFNNGFLYCEDCEVYYEDYCTECAMLVHILNKTILINADNTSRKELPDNSILEFQNYFGEFHIFALRVIPAGVIFGPFTGFNRTKKLWKIKGGKFVVDRNKSKYLNWMQYINYARNISEQNLLVFQYEHNLYYQTRRQIQEGDELLVYLGEKYEESVNRDIEMDFVPTTEQIFKDVFACTFCCLGFSSKSYLIKHKTICPMNEDRGFSIEELRQCPSCKIHLDQNEYFVHHKPYCCERNDRKCILPTSGNETLQVDGCKTRSRLIYKCKQCKYRTKYKGHLENHTNQHYQVKLHRCGVSSRRFKTKEASRLHAKNTHKKVEHLLSPYDIEQFKCSLCEFRTKHKRNVERHKAEKHAKEFNYKCEQCDYKTNRKFNLKQHTEEKHLNEFKYSCDTCDYKTNCKFHLKTHMKGKHLKEFKYKCDICDYKTSWKSMVKSHIKSRHSNEFKYKCDRCDFKTKIKCNLKTHIDGTHLKEFRYKCDTCDYKTSWKAQLKRHIDTKHLEEFKYQCATCEYKTNFKSHLKRHIEGRHLKQFKYKCHICDYKANWKTQLKTHIETKHLKEFKYKCDTC